MIILSQFGWLTVSKVILAMLDNCWSCMHVSTEYLLPQDDAAPANHGGIVYIYC